MSGSFVRVKSNVLVRCKNKYVVVGRLTFNDLKMLNILKENTLHNELSVHL